MNKFALAYSGRKKIELRGLSSLYFKSVTIPADLFYRMQYSQVKMGFVPIEEQK